MLQPRYLAWQQSKLMANERQDDANLSAYGLSMKALSKAVAGRDSEAPYLQGRGVVDRAF